MKKLFLILLFTSISFAQSNMLLLMSGSDIKYTINDNFSDGDYAGWTVSSGAYAVADATPLSGGTKALKCNTAGIISIPSTQAYGTWEFDWYKGNTANAMFIHIIADNTNASPNFSGYVFYAGSNEEVDLNKYTGSGGSNLFYTANSYFLNTTWYRIKITRTAGGIFTYYIKGGSFGTDYVLVSTAGGLGTNPKTDNTYTTSAYFVMNLDANDQIANIKVYP